MSTSNSSRLNREPSVLRLINFCNNNKSEISLFFLLLLLFETTAVSYERWSLVWWTQRGTRPGHVLTIKRKDFSPMKIDRFILVLILSTLLTRFWTFKCFFETHTVTCTPATHTNESVLIMKAAFTLHFHIGMILMLHQLHTGILIILGK